MKKRHLEIEENIKLQQAELMALFASLSPDPVFRIDADGNVNLANNAAHKTFPDENILDESIARIIPHLENFNFQNLISNGKRIDFTTEIDGRHFQFIMAGVVKNNMAQLYGRDITELKKKEEELKDALFRAEESTRLKEEFLARISHEIRSPLVAIQGYSDLLMSDLQEKLGGEYEDVFYSIQNSSKRLYRTFDLLLNMSIIQTGKYELQLEQIDLLEMLKNQYKNFVSYSIEQNLEFELDTDGEPDYKVTADHYSVEQILVNLIDNAFKFTDKGKVKISLKKTEKSVKVVIEDSGIGISRDYMNELFKPFSQEVSGYTRPYEGTGLGLALVKSFSDLNNANIYFESEKEKGTKVTVEFGN